MSFYSYQELMKQISFLSYYFHWSLHDIILLPHIQREQLCKEINYIHRQMNQEPKNIFEV